VVRVTSVWYHAGAPFVASTIGGQEQSMTQGSPDFDHTALPRSTPERQGVYSGSIDSFLQAVREIHDLHSFMLLRHGYVIAEASWRPYRATTFHRLYSLTKSFTATAVGLAVDEERFSFDDKVIGLFPDDLPDEVSDNLADMSVHHLLTMSTGHAEDTFTLIMEESENPVRAFLAQPVPHEPGTRFLYNTGASFMLSAIVQRTTGETVFDYLLPRLIGPLGIAPSFWRAHPTGILLGGTGLHITTDAIARFGQLYLQKGLWRGRRLLPEWWVNEATRKHVGSEGDLGPDWREGYGYQFWRCRHGCYRGDGAFGQFCIVAEEQDMVVAITGGLSDCQNVLSAVWEHLLPDVSAKPLEPNRKAETALRNHLRSCVITPPAGMPASPIEASVNGNIYRFAETDPLDSMTFDFAYDCVRYRFSDSRARMGEQRARFGRHEWVEDRAAIDEPAKSLIATSGTWSDSRTLQLTMCNLETPHVLTICCRFENKRVVINSSWNVSFGPVEGPEMVGAFQASDHDTEDRGGS
jgi:hypothetical protein